MTLQERAKHFVENGDPHDEGELLAECVGARNLDALAATQRLFEDMYDGITYNYEMKAPAAACLICWGKEGIKALVEGAKRTPASKNNSITLQLLSAVAVGTIPTLFMSLVPLQILKVLRPLLEDADVRSFARQQLTEYMIGFPDDGEASMAVGGVFQQLSIANDDARAVRELFAALASRWLTIGKATLASYEDLIRTHRDEEPEFQTFFEKVPQLLDPFAMLVWPTPDLHGAKKPDFVLKRADGTYLIVEIETPGKTLITSGLQISAQVTEALTQAMQYRSFLLERFQEARTHFPEFRDPDCMVVLGLERELSSDQLRALALENENRRQMRIVGFDWIAERADRILQNMIFANIAVRPLRMI
jgi:hypothetical protein